MPAPTGPSTGHYFENMKSHDCDKFQSFQENLHGTSPLQGPEAQASQKPNLPAYQVVHCLDLSDSKHADSQNWQINVSQAAYKACDKIEFYKPTQTAHMPICSNSQIKQRIKQSCNVPSSSVTYHKVKLREAKGRHVEDNWENRKTSKKIAFRGSLLNGEIAEFI